MEIRPTRSATHNDTVFRAAIAFGVGSLAGVFVSVPVWFVVIGWLDGEDLGGIFAAAIIALAIGLIAFVAAALRSIYIQAAPGDRLRPALLTFVGLPVFFLLMFSAAGLL